MTDRRPFPPSLDIDRLAVRCCVIIPSYNSGPAFQKVVEELLPLQIPLCLVIDGSTDGSDHFLTQNHSLLNPSSHTIHLPTNGGKGIAVFEGMKAARQAGYTHALIMDADGQHPAAFIKTFFETCRQNPHAIILGKPLFGKEAPWIRRLGHSIANFWVHLETGGRKIDDSLFGFRIYPLAPSIEILQNIRGGKGYDLETQLAVRLVWKGYQPLNLDVPVQYFNRAEGGISHFRYLRDNLLLIRSHCGLLIEKFIPFFSRK